ncbi:bifunctional phosphopantothenoylcysteine decarboxylase/phosphopantothenate--cysteine ligase CoaBC [Lentibacillus cibarius]|uniref:Coenzyme A biosynthesis bifunctional protein CoaBC n=1 Tax=Lentibacillus cibarius TaxID=2583219 RepID=A0A549YKF4_9BACI|nr:bifunctional phosphopantothenoylcysteine decarboxylase/phosphopantothenate--cysteine ligase CoaBC [Lentibacillus cibarius]TRM12347.1 bifunctional phosphopantothenoylcysteine decarboxylase/phosphopantothenate--cysteine ligase CoaBC [Lentibacillus cibarius]
MINNKRIVLGVSGGIAAYKACALTSKLTQQGADVKVVMTDNAQKFVSPLTFQALSRNPVYTDTFDEKDPAKIAHIDLADWADITLLAPATANIIGKVANGIADDMLSTILLATQSQVYIAPAMNVHMYAHPAVKANMKQLTSWGYHFIEPGAGYLACGYVGKGRLEEPESIITAIEEHQKQNGRLTGKKVLISAGPTKEKVDPVRFFTNRSTGKMGFALAEAASSMGAEVTLVTGPVNLSLSDDRVQRIDVVTAEEMHEAMHARFEAQDVVIKAAAVADYRPKQVYEEKMKKHDGTWQVEMERTKDILQSLAERKTDQFLVGFAAETKDPVDYGIKKLQQKDLDAIVINNVAADGAGFGGDTNIVTYVNRAHEKKNISKASKQQIARRILELILQDMKDEKK